MIDNKLLSKNIRSCYNYDETKKRVKCEIMEKYEEAKYKFINFPQPSITSSYEIRYERRVNKHTDPTSNVAEILIKTEQDIDQFYNKLSTVAKEFTREESIYFVNSLIRGKSEEVICDLLQISTNSLLPIKESCIIKIALAFDKAVRKTSL